MKILYLTTTLARYVGDPLGATGNTWLEFFQEISKSADITVIAPKIGYEDDVRKENIRVIRIAPSRPPMSLENMIKSRHFLIPPLTLYNMYKKSNEIINKEDFDIIHSFWAIPSGLIGASLDFDGKTILTCLGSDINVWGNKLLLKQMISYTLRNTDDCMCVSKEMCKRAEELGAKNVEYIPTPINLSKFKIYPEYSEPYSIVFVGRLTEKKGIYVLADALKLVKKDISDIKLYVCGDGPENYRFSEYLKKNELEKNVKLCGYVDRESVVDIIRRCKAFVLPSFAEGTPSSILEAMAIGRPIVTTDIGDLKDLINSDIGVICQKGDPIQLARSIITVLKKEYDSARIREHVERFDLENIVKSYLEIYRRSI